LSSSWTSSLATCALLNWDLMDGAGIMVNVWGTHP
jgi:hypothetical protein